MIGFEMTGRSTHGFYWHSSAWTEGSLAFAQLALSARKLPVPLWAGPFVNAPVGGAGAKEVGYIRGMFKHFKAVLLYDAAYLGMDAYMVVWGDKYFTHDFNASDSPDKAAMQLLWAVDRAELGEQVVIHLCRCIQDWRLEEITSKATNPRGLYVHLEL